MKFSLLHKTPEKPINCDVLYDLSADKAVHMMSGDIRRADYFISVLMKPLTNIGNIRYRQDILKDFIGIEKLFDDMKVIFNRYDKIKNDWRELRSGIYPAGGTVNQRALLEYTFNSLKVTAIFPKTIISFFRSIQETLGKYDIKSEGLLEFKRYCGEMIENNSLIEIADIAAMFQYNTPENFDFHIAAEFDESMRLSACDLCDITEHVAEQNSNLLKKIFTKKKTADDGFIRVADEDGDAVDDAIGILNEVLHHIDSALTYVTNDVYEIFYGVSTELQFYEIALGIMNFVGKNGTAFNFPEILPCEADKFDAVGIYDILLLCEGVKKENLIANDVSLQSDDSGILIRGLNKTGKTSYLRAIGLSQLFAQAGLPVCAESAAVSIRSAVYSHFSSAEEEFKAGDRAGRFEGEVQAISKIMDNIQPYSLLLLNETFQTTAYDEGTEGIFHILGILPCDKIKSKYVFVTRLNGLFDMMSDMNVKFLEAGHDANLYRIADIPLHKKQ